MLKTRLLTAAILIPAFVWGVLILPSLYFSLLTAVVAGVAAWEWGGLLRLVPLARGIYVLVAVGLMLAALMMPPRQLAVHMIAGIAVLWWALVAAGIFRYRDGRVPGSGWHSWGIAVGILVLVPAWLAFTALRGEPGFGPRYVLFVLALIWAADGAAYFVGRAYGYVKLLPEVSPGKTREGLWGGLSAGLGVALVGAPLLGVEGWALMWFIPLCLLVVLFSVVGDLLESLYKRRAGVKDSGRFFPGHGGALDRIDSLTAAIPVFYVGFSLLKGLLWSG